MHLAMVRQSHVVSHALAACLSWPMFLLRWWSMRWWMRSCIASLAAFCLSPLLHSSVLCSMCCLMQLLIAADSEAGLRFRLVAMLVPVGLMRSSDPAWTE